MSELETLSYAGRPHRLAYRGDIEGLRAVAIALVIGAHAKVPGLQGGFVGVDVFFVLSGYLITGLLVGEIRASGTVDLLAFYARRLRRLLPALAVMLACTFGLAVLVLPPTAQQEQAAAGASAALWLSNFHFAFGDVDYFSRSAETNLFLHTWSLGVEEQFYLVWPAFLLFVLRKRDARLAGRGLRVALGVVFAVSLVACVLATPRVGLLAFYLMPTRAWQFALGALVFLRWGDSGDGARPAPPWAGWLGIAAIVGSAVALYANSGYPGMLALIPSAGAGLVLASGPPLSGAAVGRVLELRPLQSIGRVSYAWYLWHWPVLLLGTAVVDTPNLGMRLGLAALSLALATVSYHSLEKRVTRSARWGARPAFALAAGLALMAAVDAAALRWSSYAGEGLASADFVQHARFALPEIYDRGCDDWYDSSEVRPCTFGPDDARHLVVAMGDSVGLQWFPAIAAVFDRPDWRLIVLTKSSCPMVDETIFYARIGREYTECARWRKGAIAAVAEFEPDVVIMGSSIGYELTLTQWTEGTARVLEPLTAGAQNVYVLRPTPVLPFNGPDCLLPRSRLQTLLAPDRDCSAVSFDAYAEHVRGSLADATGRFSNARLIDLNDAVCPAGRCSAELHGTIVFRDSQHLTVDFVRSLSAELAARIGSPDDGEPRGDVADRARLAELN